MTRATGLARTAAAVGLVLLSGCTAANAAKTPAKIASSSASAPTATSAKPPPAPAAAIAVSTPSGSTSVNPATPIVVSATNGTLTSIRLTNATGTIVSGRLSADQTTWTTSEDLGYSKTYSVTATARNADRKLVKKTEKFATLSPNNLTAASLDIVGGNAMANGATYGVGIVPVVHFDQPITDKAAAERALIVTTTPRVAGAWYWTDDQNVHFRPQAYWPSGTKVTISANVYGVQVGDGLYGQADIQTSFTIGAKHISIADDATHQVSTYFDGKLVHTMPTAMGKHGSETVNGHFISFYTMNGTYEVIEHDNPAIMSSASYGLPANAPGGYAPEPIYYSTKISTDGVYLHELNSTIWAQGHTDVSHGCLNLNTANASWFYNNSLLGDVVEVKNTGGPLIQEWEGGDWSVPWATWVAGSALH